MREIRLVGSCVSHAGWFGEDEAGNVVAVGVAVCVFPPESLDGEQRQIHGSALRCFIHNHLVTLDSRPDGAEIVLPRNERIALPLDMPGEALALYDHAYDPSVGNLYLVSARQIIEVSIGSKKARTIRSNIGVATPEYEQITAQHGLAVAYRVGVMIWRDGTVCCAKDQNERFYYKAMILSSDHVLAIEFDNHPHFPKSAIHLLNIRGEIVNEIQHPMDWVYFLGRINDQNFVMWDSKDSLFGGVITAHGVTAIRIHQKNVEMYAVIPSENIVAAGTLDGVILFWNVLTNEFSSVALPEPERIYGMYWSERRRTLFIGARHGNVYAMPWPKLSSISQ